MDRQLTPPAGQARLGVRLPNSGPFAEPAVLLDTAILVETLGYDRVWVHDHISWPTEKLSHFATGSIEACADQDPNFFESVSTVAFLAGRLSRIGLGIAGLVLPLRDPRILARQLTAIDQLGGSRLIVALGIGAIRGDFEVMGVPFERRGRITNDHLGALRAILGPAQPVSYSSDAVSFADGTFLPRPAGLPIWVTGSSEAGINRAARFADGWLTVYQPVEAYARLASMLREALATAGRDPATVEMGYETYVCVAATHDEAVSIARRTLENKFGTLERGLEACIVGDAAEVLERIARYVEAGASHLELKFVAHDVPMLRGMIERVARAAALPSGP